MTASDPNRARFFSLQVEPTDVCNSSCIMCPQGKGHEPHAGHGPGRLGLALFKKLVSDYSSFRFVNKNLALQWMGEPLASPLFTQFIQEIIKHDHEPPFSCLSFVTNGLMFTKELGRMLSRLRNIMVIVEFSLDAHSPDTYQLIKRPHAGGLETVRENVKHYLRLIRNKPRLWAGLRFIVMEENYKELGRFISYWRSFFAEQGIDYEITNQHYVNPDKNVRISLWPLLYPDNPELSSSLFKQVVQRYVK